MIRVKKNLLIAVLASIFLGSCGYTPTKSQIDFDLNKIEITSPQDKFFHSLEISLLDSSGTIDKIYSYTPKTNNTQIIYFEDEMGLSLTELIDTYATVNISFYSSDPKGFISDVCSERLVDSLTKKVYKFQCNAR